MSVALHRASAVTDLTKKALAFDMPGLRADGMDVLAVQEAVASCVARAREGAGPSFLVADCYRYYGHSRSDPRVYRTREEEKAWRDRDPILCFSRKMIERAILSEADVTAADEETTREIDDATEYAIASPWPEPGELYADLYA